MNSYDHELNATKGWFSPFALDKTANQAVDSANIIMGSVCSLNSNANVQMGLEPNAVPMFAFSAIDSFNGAGPAGQVANMAGHMSGRFYGALEGQAVAARRVLCLVALGAYELETTEFVEGTYAPNQPLTSAAPGEADAGKLAAGEYYVDTICGAVSDGVATNNYSKSVLRFWPLFVPAAEVSA
jgi:hypothetical protein